MGYLSDYYAAKDAEYESQTADFSVMGSYLVSKDREMDEGEDFVATRFLPDK